MFPAENLENNITALPHERLFMMHKPLAPANISYSLLFCDSELKVELQISHDDWKGKRFPRVTRPEKRLERNARA